MVHEHDVSAKRLLQCLLQPAVCTQVYSQLTAAVAAAPPTQLPLVNACHIHIQLDVMGVLDEDIELGHWLLTTDHTIVTQAFDWCVFRVVGVLLRRDRSLGSAWTLLHPSQVHGNLYLAHVPAAPGVSISAAKAQGDLSPLITHHPASTGKGGLYTLTGFISDIHVQRAGVSNATYYWCQQHQCPLQGIRFASTVALQAHDACCARCQHRLYSCPQGGHMETGVGGRLQVTGKGVDGRSSAQTQRGDAGHVYTMDMSPAVWSVYKDTIVCGMFVKVTCSLPLDGNRQDPVFLLHGLELSGGTGAHNAVVSRGAALQRSLRTTLDIAALASLVLSIQGPGVAPGVYGVFKLVSLLGVVNAAVGGSGTSSTGTLRIVLISDGDPAVARVPELITSTLAQHGHIHNKAWQTKRSAGRQGSQQRHLQQGVHVYHHRSVVIDDVIATHTPPGSSVLIQVDMGAVLRQEGHEKQIHQALFKAGLKRCNDIDLILLHSGNVQMHSGRTAHFDSTVSQYMMQDHGLEDQQQQQQQQQEPWSTWHAIMQVARETQLLHITEQAHGLVRLYYTASRRIRTCGRLGAVGLHPGSIPTLLRLAYNIAVIRMSPQVTEDDVLLAIWLVEESLLARFGSDGASPLFGFQFLGDGGSNLAEFDFMGHHATTQSFKQYATRVRQTCRECGIAQWNES